MGLLSIAALLLAAIFAIAGVAKLRDLAGSRTAMEEFGLPASLVRPAALLVPLAELLVAVALVARVGMAWAALGALLLLATFSVAIAWNLALGRTPECHCFGKVHSSPAGPGTLARNAALIALAGLVASSADFALTGLAAISGVALTGAGWALSRRAAGTDSAAPAEGLSLGVVAPSFELPRLDGVTVSLESLRRPEAATLLLFSDPQCGPCQALAPEIAEWQRRHPHEVTIVVIEQRRDGHELGATDEYGRQNVLVQASDEVAEAYRARGTPTAVLIGRDGAIASAVAGGSKEIEALMGRIVEGLLPPTSARRVPSVFGPPLGRRELLVRGAGAWAASSAVLAWPLQAVAAVSARGGRRCRRESDCVPPQRCRGRGRNARCRCPDHPRFEDQCGDDCTNFAFDDDHCGRCGTSCIPGRTTCVNGDCVKGNVPANRCSTVEGRRGCQPGAVCCEGPEDPGGIPDAAPQQCRDLKHDEKHCGRCNHACNEGKRPRCCFGRCRDLHADPRNCGECLKRCPDDKPICFGGRCRKKCPRGTRRCGRTCGHPRTEICCKGRVIDKTEAQSDPKNCGGCGTKCNGPFDTGECCNSKCCDYNADTCCPDGCKNLAHDDCNCGACGNVCPPGEYCRFGVCTCAVNPCSGPPRVCT